MSRTKVRELGRVSPTSLPLKPTAREDEIPHWKVWAWVLRNPGKSWKK